MTRVLTPEQFAAHQARFGRSREVVDTNITPPRTAGQALAEARHERWKALEAACDQPRGPASIVLVLPWPPSGNHSHGQTADGGRYLLPHVREYRRVVAERCLGMPRVSGPYRLRVELSPPDARKRDADNALKALVDAIKLAGMLPDDSMTYMRELHALVRDDRGGNALVSLEEVA